MIMINKLLKTRKWRNESIAFPYYGLCSFQFCLIIGENKKQLRIGKNKILNEKKNNKNYDGLITERLRSHLTWFSFEFPKKKERKKKTHYYTTYGLNISWLPSPKIMGRRFNLAAVCILSSIDKLLLYSLKFTICRWCWSKFGICFDWWIECCWFECWATVFVCCVNSNKLASSIFSLGLFVGICSLIGPLIDCFETRFALETVFEPVVAVDTDVCDDDDDDDVDDVDAFDDDFFSFASCWAFFERFHFIRRFWNQILTWNYQKGKTKRKKKKKLFNGYNNIHHFLTFIRRVDWFHE